MSLAERKFRTPGSLRLRLLNGGRRPAMGGASSIAEGFSELRRKLMGEPRYIKVQRGKESDLYVPDFAKKDFKDGVSGSTGHDLTSAVSQKLVITGDLITYTLPVPDSQGEQTKVEVAYVGTADLTHGGRLGFHKFLRVGEDAGRNVLYLGGDAFPWRKTGHIEVDELLAKIDRSLSSPSQPRY